ncbi:MAG: LamG-like jellyroll fold domain-containing protein [Oligoflexales bacterium]
MAAGDDCTYIVRFSAADTGAEADTVLLDYHNGVAAATQVTKGVSATGVSVASLAFDSPAAHGDVPVGGTSDVTYTVTNSGGYAANSIAFTGLSGEWSRNGGTCGADLAAGDDCTYIVRFLPVDSGVENATLAINYHNGAVAATQIDRAVVGTGKTVALIVIDNPTAHGTWVLNETKDITYTVSNTGETSATSINITGLAGEWSATSTTCGASLDPLANCAYVVRLTATTIGSKSDTIEIDYHNGVTNASQVTRSVSSSVVTVDASANVADVLTGDDSANTISGGFGGDTINGGAGNDILYPDFSSTYDYFDYLRANEGMMLWLDGADPYGSGVNPVDGALLTTWVDKSTKGYDFSDGDGAIWKRSDAQGRGGFYFNGSNSYFERAHTSNLNLATTDIFVVADSHRDDSGDRSPLTSRVGSSGWSGYYFYHNSSGYWNARTGDGSTDSGGSTNLVPQVGQPNLLEMSLNATTADKYFDGSGVSCSNCYVPNTVYPTRVGAGKTELTTPELYFHGYISEILIFNQNLSDYHVEAVRQALANRHGLKMIASTQTALSADTLTGGAGADTFVFSYQTFTDASNPDVITDFSGVSGGENDKIDLSGIPFKFYVIGTSSFTSTGESELRWSNSSGNTLIEGDWNGDGTANWAIQLSSFTHSNLLVGDFKFGNAVVLNSNQNTLDGDDGSDTLTGGDDEDTISGYSGDDILVGGYDGDTLNGGDGDDVLYPDFETFNKGSISNLKFWVDAEHVADGDTKLHDGDSVILWKDRSESGFDASSTGTPPTYKQSVSGFNGQPGLAFSAGEHLTLGSNYLFSSAADGGLTIMSVLRSDAREGSEVPFVVDFGFYAGYSYGIVYSTDYGFSNVLNGNGGSANFLSCPCPESVIFSNVYNFGNQQSAYVNGTLGGTGSLASVAQLGAAEINENPTRTAGGGPFTIGVTSKTGFAATRHFNGDMGEIMVFSAALNTTQRGQVERYFSMKYGMALDGLTIGSDTLTGGAGADRFVWSNASASPASSRDIITDFDTSENDKIDLADLRADITVKGHGGEFLGEPDTLIWSQSGVNTLVQIDYDGDRSSDFEILLQGFTSSSLSISDFILPVEPIVTADLFLHLDPAHAQGRGFPGLSSADCSDAPLVFKDLSGNINGNILENFDDCASGENGWQGSGARDGGISSPYHMTLDGSNDQVALGTISQDLSAGFTYDGWMRIDRQTDLDTAWSLGESYNYNSIEMGQNGSGANSFVHVSNTSSSNSFNNQTSIVIDQWAYYAVTDDGTTSKLYFNGIETASTTSLTSIVNTTRTDNYIGKRSGGLNHQNSAYGPMRFYSDDLSASQIKDNFMAQANRFRKTPVEDIVTEGLYLNLDPANAVDGLRFPGVAASDCSDLHTDWYDLSPSNLPVTMGAMDNCGAGNEGWQGTGIPSDPYRFRLSGISDDDRITVDLGSEGGSTQGSVSFWLKSDGSWLGDGGSNGASPGSCGLLKLSGTGSLRIDWNPGPGSGSSLFFYDADGQHTGSTTGVADNSNWYHVTLVFSSRSGDPLILYVNGVPEISKTVVSDFTFDADYMYIADRPGDTFTEECDMELGGIQLYNRALTVDEVKRNCHAQEGRFTSADDICASF